MTCVVPRSARPYYERWNTSGKFHLSVDWNSLFWVLKVVSLTANITTHTYVVVFLSFSGNETEFPSVRMPAFIGATPASAGSRFEVRTLQPAVLAGFPDALPSRSPQGSFSSFVVFKGCVVHGLGYLRKSGNFVRLNKSGKKRPSLILSEYKTHVIRRLWALEIRVLFVYWCTNSYKTKSAAFYITGGNPERDLYSD